MLTDIQKIEISMAAKKYKRVLEEYSLKFVIAADRIWLATDDSLVALLDNDLTPIWEQTI